VQVIVHVTGTETGRVTIPLNVDRSVKNRVDGIMNVDDEFADKKGKKSARAATGSSRGLRMMERAVEQGRIFDGSWEA